MGELFDFILDVIFIPIGVVSFFVGIGCCILIIPGLIMGIVGGILAIVGAALAFFVTGFCSIVSPAWVRWESRREAQKVVDTEARVKELEGLVK